ncbi:MAG: ABC transporter ATP-binding protein [Negativicoccus succinicivorans]|nr:ABC transporter ATP-binding protein [Negativicoccus succinicivorans]MDU5395422.1 ABC transporter ATP-binding protein [Negativicoccus succinicivorans]
MIEFDHITKRYKGNEVLRDVTLTIPAGETVCLIGESGSGKTTLLKMINRLIQPSSGEIRIDGENIAKKDVLALRRNIGYVIQQTGLFPHMTIAENIEVIPRALKMPVEQIKDRTAHLLDMVGLDAKHFLHRYPSELSGGQQQRIGVARAFACDPNIILMDEPFSALDPLTRTALQDEVSSLQNKLHKTIVFVTHDMDEAIRLGDRICIIDKGVIAQYDTPENILKNPANQFVADFIGKNRIWNSPELIRAEDIMVTSAHTCGPDLTAFRALERMRRAHVNGLLVIDLHTRELLGSVFAQKLRALDDLQTPVADVMETHVETVAPSDTLVDTLTKINAHNLYYIPVVDENHSLLGLITQSSLVTTLSQQYIEDEEVQA